MIGIIKDCISELAHAWHTRDIFNRRNSWLKGLESNGTHMLPDYWTKETCDRVIHELKSIMADPSLDCLIWQDDMQADHRLHGFELFSKNPKVLEFYEYSKTRAQEYLGYEPKVGFILAARMVCKENNLGSGGGWHRDSAYQHQFKSILYLSDVLEHSGPFSFLKGSHRFLSKLRNGEVGSGKTRYSDSDINRLLITDENMEKKCFVADAGSLLMADTRGIHRGEPIEKGERFALTCYFWRDKYPPQFEAIIERSRAISSGSVD